MVFAIVKSAWLSSGEEGGRGGVIAIWATFYHGARGGRFARRKHPRGVVLFKNFLSDSKSDISEDHLFVF